jgi:hypothetical protein
MMANAVGCEAAKQTGMLRQLCHRPAATQDRGNFSVSVATVEIVNPLGPRVVATYCELWYERRTKECALTLRVNRRHESELSLYCDG